MPSKKVIKTWKNRCINPFQEERHKANNYELRGVSYDLRLKFPTLPEGSQICSSCWSQFIDTAGISSYLNSDNIAELSGRDQLHTEDYKMIINDDENLLHDN